MEQPVESLPRVSIVNLQDMVVPPSQSESMDEVLTTKQDVDPSVDAAPYTTYDEATKVKQEDSDTNLDEGIGNFFDASESINVIDAFEPADPKIESSDHDDAPRVPTFDELEREGAINLRDPTPGYLRFPGAFNSDGTRNPIRDVFASRERDILPPAYEPLWKQMLNYCQRWSVWIATIENDERRSELTQWVTQKMQEAWDFGIKNGHCGEPNGHKYCCLAHAPHGEDAQKRKQQKESKKKTVDHSKQLAPFSSDGNKHPYAIINRELDDAEISTETILDRVTSEDIEAGNELLDEMCGLLGRDALEQQDWTMAKYGKFDPRLHSRNLLMFSLWEVQRCRNVISNSTTSLSKANTPFQQKNWQKRIDTYQQRADQHLVLALVLQEQRGEEPSEDEKETSHAPVEEEVSTRPRRCTKPLPALEVLSDEDNDSEDAYMASDESKRPEPESIKSSELVRDALSHTECPSSSIMDNDSPRHNNNDTADLELGSYFSDEMYAIENELPPPQIGDKRILIADEANDEPATKKFKLDDQLFDPIQYNESENEMEFDIADPKLEFNTKYSQEGRSVNLSPVSENENAVPVELVQSLHEHATTDDDVHEYVHMDINTPRTKPRKQEYVTRYWQPRINALAMQYGRGPLTWALRDWTDIKSVLDNLGFNLQRRNQYLRDFKAGFVEWRQATGEQRPQQNQFMPATALQVQSTSRIRENTMTQHSLANVTPPESSRGFFFRYHPLLTKEERDFVDNMVIEYIESIIHSKTNRFGFYAVFIMTGDESQKELAHGVWELQKHKRPEDAEWFFQDQSKPVHFRASEIPIHHEWGYSLAPPERRKPTKAITQGSRDDSSNDDFEVSHTPTSRGRGSRSRKRTNHDQNRSKSGTSRDGAGSKTRVSYTGRIRRAKRIVDDSDDEWQPNDE